MDQKLTFKFTVPDGTQTKPIDLAIYDELSELLEESFNVSFSDLNNDQNLLLREVKNKLNNLRSLSLKIRELIGILENDQNPFIRNEEIKDLLKKQGIDLNRTVMENFAMAYPTDSTQHFSDEVKSKVKELENSTRLYYQDAYRICTIFRKDLGFTKFNSQEIDVVRNNLLEHPENKPSGVFDSFVYSKIDGPMIKGLRVGEQIQDMDKGFYFNENQFLEDIKSVLIIKIGMFKM